MKTAFSILAALALSACAPILGDVRVTIAPSCGVTGGQTATTRCDTTISIDGKSDPVLTASPVIVP